MKRLSKPSQDLLIKFLLQLQRKPMQEKGYIIVVAMGMVLALTTMLITAALTSKADTNSSRASAKSARGFYAAEAGLNIRAKTIRSTFTGYNVPGHNGTDLSPSSSAACKGTNTSLMGSGDFACDNSQTFQGQAVSTFVVDSNSKVGGVPQPTSVTIGAGEQFAGLSAQEYRYDVTSVAFDNENQPTASLQMRFKSRLVPLFQFAAFYSQDMDFSIPPNMNMHGPIHSNSDIYLDASSSSTLNLYGAVTTAGNLFRGERLDTTCNGTVNIASSSGIQLPLSCGSGRKQYSNADVSGWGGNIQVGVPALTLPPISSFNPSAGSDYWDKADLRIVLNLDNSENPTSIQLQNADGSVSSSSASLQNATCSTSQTTMTQNLSGSNAQTIKVNSVSGYSVGQPIQIIAGNIVDNDSNVLTGVSSSSKTLTIAGQIGNALGTSSVVPNKDASNNWSVVSKPVVWTSNTFWNYREKADTENPTVQDATQIRMLNVDMRGLMSCANQLMGGKNLDDTTDGGLVWYLTVKGPKSLNDVTGAAPNNTSNTYGVRLYNGATLASNNSGDPAIKGLTVVSDQAVYIQGNYNSNNKKPAAIMGDTINVLSNNWTLDDSHSRTYNGSGVQNSYTNVTSRTTSDTTINAAFLAGIDLSGGGLNNYPRFHEYWSGSTLTYLGSMVSLGLPRRVNSPFCGSLSTNPSCNIYSPPYRNWDYDTDFNNAANLPPLTPRFVYLRQERFSRDFNRVSFLNPPNAVATLASSTFLSVIPSVSSSLFQF